MVVNDLYLVFYCEQKTQRKDHIYIYFFEKIREDESLISIQICHLVIHRGIKNYWYVFAHILTYDEKGTGYFRVHRLSKQEQLGVTDRIDFLK